MSSSNLRNLFREVYTDNLMELVINRPSIVDLIQAEDRRSRENLYYAPVILGTEHGVSFNPYADELELRVNYEAPLFVNNPGMHAWVRTDPIKELRKTKGFRKFHR